MNIEICQKHIDSSMMKFSWYRWGMEMLEISHYLTKGSSKLLEKLECASSEGNPYAMFNLGVRLYASDRERSFELFTKGDELGSFECTKALARMLWDRKQYDVAVKKHFLCVENGCELENTLLRSKLHLGSLEEEVDDFEIFLRVVSEQKDKPVSYCVLGAVYMAPSFWGRPESFQNDFEYGCSLFEKAASLGSMRAKCDLKKLEETPNEFLKVVYDYNDYFLDNSFFMESSLIEGRLRDKDN